ncbi:hypothetical protein BHM03_00040312, partial [Ensete ventricosum]
MRRPSWRHASFVRLHFRHHPPALFSWPDKALRVRSPNSFCRLTHLLQNHASGVVIFVSCDEIGALWFDLGSFGWVRDKKASLFLGFSIVYSKIVQSAFP